MTSFVANLTRAAFTTPMVFVVAIAIALAANEVFFHFIRRVGRRWADRSASIAIARRGWWPSRFLVAAIACLLVLPAAHLSAVAGGLVGH
jgi:hypothetical protein